MRYVLPPRTCLIGALVMLAATPPAAAEVFYLTFLRTAPIFKCDGETGEITELPIELPAELAARVPTETGASGRGRGTRGRGSDEAPFMEITALAADRDHVYWIDNLRGLLLRANADGKNVKLLLDLWEFQDNRDFIANGMTLHDGRLIWTSVRPGREVFSAGIDGGEPRLLVDIVANFGARNQTPMSVTVFDDRIYWIDPLQDGIFAADLDGTSPEKVREAYGEGSLALSPQGAYWPGGSLQIVRGRIGDTADPEPVLKNNRAVHKLAARADKLYWTDTQGVHRADLDGSGAELICARTGTTVGFAPVW